jgi:CheY-like chemotaxis protein
MIVLIAEDDRDTAISYKRALEERNHQVIITNNGEDCLTIYHDELDKVTPRTLEDASQHTQPFDVIILDHKMPKRDGMEVAKEILALNPHQRIIFASAYIKETLVESVKQLTQLVELLQKPFGEDTLIDTIEDKEIYSELQKLNVNVKHLKAANLRHEQIRNLLDSLKRIQKGRTF